MNAWTIAIGNIKPPETDWKAVADFLAAYITQEKPSYALLIMQVIADSTTTHGAASRQKGITA